MSAESGGSPSVRFFTTAALRAHEEIAGEAVRWIPQSITVEYDDNRPVTGVWRSFTGERRICWYATEPGVELRAAHAERYGDEPFWIIDRGDPDLRRLRVLECGIDIEPVLVRHWEFDRAFMPSREEERSADGTVRMARTYRCTFDGTVYAATEQRPGQSPVELPRPITFPALELAGEPFPLGGTIGQAGPRLVASIAQNSYQGRFLAVYRDGAEWKRGLATIATSKGWPESARSVISFVDDRVAPLVALGQLEHSRRDGYAFLGVVEALPEGQTLEEVVLEQPLLIDEVLAIAMEVADVAARAHAAGHQLGGIRPELVYVERKGTQVVFAGLAHRGPSVLASTYSGEGVRWPPIFAADFSSADDTRGLAQLVWYSLTGRHPFLAAGDLRWNETWNEFRHRRTSRQPWSGPAHVGRVLEQVLFESQGTPDFASFVAELRRLQARR